MIKVFVYGTLLEGQGNHRLLETSKKVMDNVTMSLSAKMVSLGHYPALIMTSEINNIKGEVYEVTEEVLCSLDYLEGHPNFYKRHEINEIWVYFLSDEYDTKKYTVIEDGDWRRFHKETTERRKYG